MVMAEKPCALMAWWSVPRRLLLFSPTCGIKFWPLPISNQHAAAPGTALEVVIAGKAALSKLFAAAAYDPAKPVATI